MKVVLALSGGLDSSTLCGYYLDKGYEVIPVTFNYGAKHNRYENEACIAVARHFGLSAPVLLDLKFIRELFRSDLLLSGSAVPEGHYTDQSMAATVVPARNLIFASIVAGYADSIDAEVISLGVHGGDHHIYPDCRPAFVSSLNTSVMLATDGKVRVDAPFLYYTKGEILRMGMALPTVRVPYEMTRTCYKDQLLSCGKCGSCVERLEAFAELGVTDPIKYAV
ncbi:7-cyano-7-deazaguanine synthase QueC [Geomonas paludis]|uniref:7-cyano-7-deazaguanine synthase n=1 Tax=Geomonas paludis TaxID=2740185 RepID=A0A6V8N3L7_9BACT|nr:7-cyano-7-deazaguanine synthase QueC [Geomonas paludis]UPU36626.1 7-cyano-7-deazaguanine synthase QueC [Geomonas paludis]GFO65889.1 7-cyano-7-deazaguanine synthase [Geomonas paludis]